MYTLICVVSLFRVCMWIDVWQGKVVKHHFFFVSSSSSFLLLYLPVLFFCLSHVYTIIHSIWNDSFFLMRVGERKRETLKHNLNPTDLEYSERNYYKTLLVFCSVQIFISFSFMSNVQFIRIIHFPYAYLLFI